MTSPQHGSDPSPECSLDEHQLCEGPQQIRRPGAPSWEAPVVVLRCTCRCHTQTPGRREAMRDGRDEAPLTL